MYPPKNISVYPDSGTCLKRVHPIEERVENIDCAKCLNYSPNSTNSFITYALSQYDIQLYLNVLGIGFRANLFFLASLSFCSTHTHVHTLIGVG